MTGDLARDCADLAAAATEAVAWFESNRAAVGANFDHCRRSARYIGMRSRQLEKAARLPMAVSVYGPSQVGKSYMIESLARKGTNPLLVILGDETADFLAEINLDMQGNESTGLVTRFTLRPSKAPKTHPVTLQLLSQTDLIKILTNTYFTDFNPAKEQQPSADDVVAALDAAERAVRPGRVDTLLEVDIDDLSRYFEDRFQVRKTHAVLKTTGYWRRLEDLAPRLPIAERIKLYGFLWGQIPHFNQLYGLLYAALESLDFAETAYCVKSALIPRDNSILSVTALHNLGQADTVQIEVVTDSGRRASIGQSQLAAIVAELVITIKEQPWEFFRHTDLLDFPGARSREIIDDAAYYAQQPGAMSNLFRRGKVAHLFDRFCQQMELTSMLLCLTPGNQEVKTLPGIIHPWIRIFQGDTPAERAMRQTALFFVITKFDLRFSAGAGADKDSTGRWAGAISILTTEFSKGRDNWVANWTPEQPFNNVYFFRSTSYPAPILVKTEKGKEVALQDPEDIARLKAEYLVTDLVQRHVRDPDKAWEEVLRLNDGGITYLAASLAPVCHPETKLGQLRKRLGEEKKDLRDLLVDYHVSDNPDEEAGKRRQAAEGAVSSLAGAIDNQRFMYLVNGLQLSGNELLYAFQRQGVGQGATAADPPRSAGPGTRMLEKILGKKPTDANAIVPPANDPMDQLALVALQQWTSQIQHLAQQQSLLGFLDVDAESVDIIARELMAASDRLELRREVSAAMKATLPVLDEKRATLFKASLAAVEVVNRFVLKLGEDRRSPSERTRVGSTPVFQELPRIDSLPTLPEESESYNDGYIADWIVSFLSMVEHNARGGTKRRFSAEETARLQKIWERLVED